MPFVTFPDFEKAIETTGRFGFFGMRRLAGSPSFRAEEWNSTILEVAPPEGWNYVCSCAVLLALRTTSLPEFQNVAAAGPHKY